MTTLWKKDTWRNYPIVQQPHWPSIKAIKNILDEIESLPALVYAGETRTLLEELAAVSEGQAFLLQAGDCAEDFFNCSGHQIHNMIKVILQMAIVITYSGEKKVVKIGRMAGQYAKPRSSETETINGIELPSYRGDMVNGFEFSASQRTPDPNRIIEGYYKSAATLNLVRAFTKGGYASLDQVSSWNEVGEKSYELSKNYKFLVKQIKKAVRFTSAIGLDPHVSQINEVSLFTSHEALLLDYEEVMTRVDTTTGDWYDTSGHFLWVGDRTRNPGGAHVEFLRGVGNPIGIKLGPSIDPKEIPLLCEKLNPDNIAGKITLITRYGANRISEELPKAIEVVKNEGLNVVWCCDPMHGNTTTINNHKTRIFDNILEEIKSFWQIHNEHGTYPGGVHIELTGDNVTECIGGLAGITNANLSFNYTTHCDPRLNSNQALQLAFEIADILKV